MISILESRHHFFKISDIAYYWTAINKQIKINLTNCFTMEIDTFI